jgi:hypothetical protein
MVTAIQLNNLKTVYRNAFEEYLNFYQSVKRRQQIGEDTWGKSLLADAKAKMEIAEDKYFYSLQNYLIDNPSRNKFDKSLSKIHISSGNRQYNLTATKKPLARR